MTIDRRLTEIQREADDREPTQVASDQFAVIVDNMMASYWRDPKKTDAMLRRDGHVKTADRLTAIFGAEWWERL